MSHRPVRPPASSLERSAHDLAAGRRPSEAVAELARNAGLDDAQIEAAKADPSQGVGTIDSRVVVIALPIETVRKLLPLGLELAPQPLTFPDKHPVFLMFSHDHFEAWFGDMDYNEMMVGVPYVQRSAAHVANRGPFIYMPRLYLDDETPKVLGNLLYGFEKQMGAIANDADQYRVTTPDTGRLIAAASFREGGEEQPPSAYPHFDAVRQVFDMPTVSQALRIVDPDAFDEREFVSPFLCSTITYDFSDTKATIQPLTAEVQLTEELTPPGLPTTAFSVPSLAHEVLGAFRLKCPQVVSLPGSCAEQVFRSPAPPRKKRVAVLGGGPSSLAAAYYLARQKDRYEVEVYTTGWRLGGKCAAGRNGAANDRVEEHGLHAFVGFYENGFRTMREVYEDAGLQIAIGTPPYDYEQGEGPVAGGFIGCDAVGVFEKWKGDWRYFATPQKFNGKVPGQIPEGGEEPSPHFGTVVTGALRRVVHDTASLLGIGHGGSDRAARFEAQKDESRWRRWVDDVKEYVQVETHGIGDALEQLVSYIETLAVDAIAHQIEEGSRLFKGVAWLLSLVRGALRVVLKSEIENDPEVYFIWQGLDTLLTAFIGVIKARTVNLDDLDDYDFREWLLDNGLDPRNAQASAITQVYETLFAHASDAPVPDKMAAGVGLRWFLLVGFLYKGYPAYFFRYSCPQTMCTPYYLALQKLGAKVHFFHQVVDLDIQGSGEQRQLRGVKMQVQATTTDGAPYDPLLRGLPKNPPDQPAWPNHPKFDTLLQGPELRERKIDLENPWSGWEGVGEKYIELGRDFDLCICGIPISVFPAIANQLTDPRAPTHAPPWRAMVDGISVIQTVSTQLWMQPTMSELATPEYGMLTSFAQPEPSMGDFTHLLQWEEWGPGGDTPQALAYHTGSLVAISVDQGYPNAQPDYPEQETQRWKEMFAGWLRENFQSMYDRVPDFDAMLKSLATSEPATGIDRLWQQYFNISVHPSDLYVLSQPKAMQLRLGPAESWVRGLFLCGDWTRTDINCGCVEASTQSGMLASRVISNHPRYVWHPGF